MIHVYDTVIEPYATQIERYGAKYKLENKTKMENQYFYTFKAPDRETIIVIPRFAEQYREVEKFCKKYFYCKKLETCKVHIQRDISKTIKIDKMPNSDSATGIMYVISAVYKDISVSFNYMNNKMELAPEFEIVANNVFGNGIHVTMGLNV